jgi:hypothetical protein
MPPVDAAKVQPPLEKQTAPGADHSSQPNFDTTPSHGDVAAARVYQIAGAHIVVQGLGDFSIDMGTAGSLNQRGDQPTNTFDSQQAGGRKNFEFITGEVLHRGPNGSTLNMLDGHKLTVDKNGCVSYLDKNGNKLTAIGISKDMPPSKQIFADGSIMYGTFSPGEKANGTIVRPNGEIIEFKDGQISSVEHGPIKQTISPDTNDSMTFQNDHGPLWGTEGDAQTFHLTHPNQNEIKSPQELGQMWDQAAKNTHKFDSVNDALLNAGINALNEGGLPALQRLQDQINAASTTPGEAPLFRVNKNGQLELHHVRPIGGKGDELAIALSEDSHVADSILASYGIYRMKNPVTGTSMNATDIIPPVKRDIYTER